MIDTLMLNLVADFHFLRPNWFYALIPAVLLFVLVKRRQQQGSSWERAIDASLLPYLLALPTQTGSRRLLNLLLVGWLLAIIALAGPVWLKTPQPVHEREDALVIILDLSRSMYAIDIKPNRLVRAQRKLQDLLTLRKEGVTALIAYAGDAHTVSPLTDDANTISEMIPAVTPEIMPAPGSQLAPALNLAVQLFTDAGVASGRILLLTDEIRDIAESQAIAREHRTAYPISVMSVGTAAGAPIDGSRLLRDGGYLKDFQGNLVIPRVNLSAMQDFAQVAGGRYSPMTLTDEDLDYLLADEALSPTTDFREQERDFDVWFEEGPWLVLLLLPLAALCFRRGWLWSLPLLLILPHERAEASLWDDLWATRDQQAQQALNQGDAASAASLFKNEAWRAAARYRSEDYAGAANDYAQQISEAAGSEQSGTGDDAYNLGNSLARLGEYEAAIEAYEQALTQNPDDADAAANKQLVEDILQQQQQDQESSEDGDDQEAADESSDQDSTPGDPNDQEPSDSDQSADADGEPQDDENTEAEQQQPTDQDQDAKDEKMAEEDTQPLDDEERQALENWLRKVPDDPGGLLRRKFEMQYSDRLRQGRSNNNGNQSNW
ncbi:VWA domain-containing protein [Pseudomonadales bacterium]|nr:VWA domain-containing protein [Pseudomonadales bacterium]